MLNTSSFEFDRADDRAGDRAQPRRRAHAAALPQRRGPRRDRRRGLPDRARAVQHRAQRAAPPAARRRRPRARDGAARQPQPRRPQRADEVGSKIVAIGILPTIMPEHYEGEWISRNNRYTALNDSIFVARGEDIYLDIEGPTGERVATLLRLHRARVRVHVGPAAPAGRPGGVRRALERRAGARRRRRSRSPPTRRSSSASGSTPRPGSSCSSRPPTPARSS